MAYDSQPKELPNNLSAEAALLGSILYDPDWFDRLRDVVQPSDFFDPNNAEIWQSFLRLETQGITIGGPSVQESIDSLGTWAGADGLQPYLVSLLESASFGPEVRDYAGLIARLASRRRLAQAGSAIEALALQPGNTEGVSSLLERALDEVNAVDDARISSGEWLLATDGVEQAIDKLEDKLNAKNDDPHAFGISTGLSGLDESIRGMHPSDLIIVAGRPGMGKTALVSNILFGAAKSGAKAAFFSQEMSREQLAYRAASRSARLAGIGKVEYRDLRGGDIGQNDLAILRAGLKSLPRTVAWDTSAKLSAGDIRARCRSARKKLQGLDLVVIDYLGLMNLQQERGETKTNAIGRTTGALKALAKELGVPVILLSQLSRNVEQRDNKRPFMSDLRDSGDIEQDADIIIFAYRDEYYLGQKEPKNIKTESWTQWSCDMEAARGQLELIVAKARMSGSSTVTVHFEPSTDCVVDHKGMLTEEAMV